MKYSIVFIGLFLFFMSVFAQDQSLPEQIDSEQTSGEEIVNEKTQEPAENSSGRQNAEFDVFRPTEDISEDLPVPFPVDI